MRKVIVSKCSPVEIGETVFHPFGVDYKEFEVDPWSFATAVINKGDEWAPLHETKNAGQGEKPESPA